MIYLLAAARRVSERILKPAVQWHFSHRCITEGNRRSDPGPVYDKKAIRPELSIASTAAPLQGLQLEQPTNLLECRKR
ncbi:hypothetical protein [Rhizobium multihospitium]|uniref:hypothetical protein n=1 Tax=Rhizobium multihospitium TaxID=410764 RepID=UPI00114CE3F3|nr:hypothetical protein [Rhizobium multihospitium]